MVLSKSQKKLLHRLISGESIAASTFRKDVATELLDEGLLTVKTHGYRRSYAAIDVVALCKFVESHYGGWEFVNKDGLTRAEMASETGDSKLVMVRSCLGVPVNSYAPIPCMLNGQKREIKRIQEFVERARNAKRSNTALIRQGHVREKMLDRKMAELELREEEYQRVALNVSPSKQSGKTPLEIQGLTFHYDHKPPLYEKLSFMLTRGEKFLIVGENGIGKSTLLKLIVGQLKPDEGSIIFSQNTTVAYYAQELEILNERETILDNVKSYDYTDTEMRSMLANFLFRGDDVYKRVSVLSPGEKARVALCKILTKRANLIILDEPTNHFDPETQKIIGENFRDYDGTVIMVSHNPSFVEQVGITRMLVLPSHEPGKPALGIIKNYSREQLEYYYYLNSDLV